MKNKLKEKIENILRIFQIESMQAISTFGAIPSPIEKAEQLLSLIDEEKEKCIIEIKENLLKEIDKREALSVSKEK